jgi:hypothetical protein
MRWVFFHLLIFFKMMMVVDGVWKSRRIMVSSETSTLPGKTNGAIRHPNLPTQRVQFKSAEQRYPWIVYLVECSGCLLGVGRDTLKNVVQMQAVVCFAA